MNALDKIYCKDENQKRLGEVGKILQALEVCTRAVRSDCCSILMFRIIGLIIGPYEIYCFVGLSSSSQQSQDLIR